MALLAAIVTAGAASAAQRPFSVQVGAVVPTVSSLPLYVAQRTGFFAAEGLNVEIRLTGSSPQTVQLVAAGRADAGWQSIEPIISGYDKGVRGKIVMAIENELIYYIAVPQDSPIRTVADLRGRKIGVISLASAGVPVFKSILRAGGVQVGPEQIVPVGIGAQGLAALNSGKVDALGQFDAVYFALERAGHPFRYFKHPQLAEFGNGGVFVNDTVWTQRKQDVCGFGRATAKAALFVLTNPQAALQIWWEVMPGSRRGATPEAQRAAGLPEIETIAKTFDLGFPPAANYGAIDPAKFGLYLDLLKQEGVISAKPPVSAVMSNELAACINHFDSDKVRAFASAWKP